MQKRTQHIKLYRQKIIFIVLSVICLLSLIITLIYRASKATSVRTADQQMVADLLDPKKNNQMMGRSQVGYVMTCANNLNDRVIIKNFNKKLKVLIIKGRKVAENPLLKKQSKNKLVTELETTAARQDWSAKDIVSSYKNLEKLIADSEKEISEREKVKKRLDELQKVVDQAQDLLNQKEISENDHLELEGYLNEARRLMQDENTSEDAAFKLTSKIQSVLPRISESIKKKKEEDEKKLKEDEDKKNAEKEGEAKDSNKDKKKDFLPESTPNSTISSISISSSR